MPYFYFLNFIFVCGAGDQTQVSVLPLSYIAMLFKAFLLLHLIFIFAVLRIYPKVLNMDRQALYH
jgi:hypothetical protein